MRQKKNNGGFTLIELLVAVAILALVMVPLMRSFITAAQTNLKSRRILEATTVGQNLMENIKVESMEALEAAPWSVQKDVNGVIQYYYQGGTPATTVNGREFYARVYLDGTNFTTSPTVTGAAATDYNSLLWAKMSNLSKTNNAFLIMKPNEAELVAQEMSAQLPPGSGVNAVDIRQDMRRDITVNLSHTESTGLSIVKVSVKYSYTHGGRTYEYLAMSNQEMYNNGMNLSNVLSGVFLCYYPLYNNAPGAINETVTFENPANYPVELYLVRQQGGTSANSGYALDLAVSEDTDRLKSENGAVSATSIITNLTYNEGNPSNGELRLSYGTDITHAGLWTGSNGLERGEAADHIYTVKIEIYEKKDGDNYESKDLLTALEGTKIE